MRLYLILNLSRKLKHTLDYTARGSVPGVANSLVGDYSTRGTALPSLSLSGLRKMCRSRATVLAPSQIGGDFSNRLLETKRDLSALNPCERYWPVAGNGVFLPPFGERARGISRYHILDGKKGRPSAVLGGVTDPRRRESAGQDIQGINRPRYCGVSLRALT